MPELRLLQGGKEQFQAQIDWVALLEDMDIHDSWPILKAIALRSKTVANSPLAAVPSMFEATAHGDFHLPHKQE